MTRVLSALVLVAILVAALFAAPWWGALLLACAAAVLAASEVAALAAAVGAAVSTPVTVTGAAVVCIAMALSHETLTGGPLGPMLLALIVGAGLVALASGAPSPATVTRAAVMFMAPVYVGVPLGALGWVDIIYGPFTLLFLIVLISVSDSAQYFCGRAFGRVKLAPAISPAKTREGAIGGLVAAAIIGAVVAPQWISGTLWMEGALLGTALAAVGIAGDLFESMLKRGAGVKDSSTLIPGHGGVLDRIDAYLFAAPAYVLYLRYLA
ncbi:MAG: phosphatidate cytidylyltransferase [Vicinamibacterales bacterium]